MRRTSFFLALAFCTSLAHGFPAPKPKEAPTNAEVGQWELVRVDGKHPLKLFLWEFTKDGRWRIFGAPGTGMIGGGMPYKIEKSALILHDTELSIHCLNSEKLVVDTGNGVLEFRRRR